MSGALGDEVLAQPALAGTAKAEDGLIMPL